jgi:hypothetical protein
MGFQSQDIEHQERSATGKQPAQTPSTDREAQQLGKKEKTTNPDQPPKDSRDADSDPVNSTRDSKSK